MRKHQNINPLTDMDQFVGSLQKEDLWYSKLTKVIQVVMIILAVLYGGFFIINPDPDIDMIKRIGGFCYVVALLIFIIILRKLYHEFRHVDYGLPVTDMLRNAIKRYGLFQKKMLWLIFPIMLIYTAMVLISVDPENGRTFHSQMVLSVELLVPSFLVGTSIGYIIWVKRQKPLRDAAKAMLREIES